MIKAKHWKFGLVFLAVLAVCIITLMATSEYSCLGTESSAYFKLPSSANSLEKHAQSRSRSCTLWLKFHMKPADMDGFLATTFIRPPLSLSILPRSIGGIVHLQEETGWKLNSMSSFLAGEATGTGERFLDEQMLIIDTSNPSNYVVYLTTKKNWL